MRKQFSVIEFWDKVVYNGKFFIKEINKRLCSYIKVYWKIIIYGNKVSFKIVFIVWLVLNGNFFIKDKVVFWGIIIYQICNFYAEKDENIVYLLFDCKNFS